VRTTSSLLLAFALVVSTVASGCSGDDDSATARTTSSARATTTSGASTTTSSAAPTSTTTATTTAPTTATTVPCPVPAFGSIAPQTSPMPSDVMVITDVRVRTQRCTDTVAFDFDSSAPQAPGFTVEYQKGPFSEDGSGKPVAVAGSAFLVVRMEPATGFDFVRNREAYTGPARFSPNGAFVREAVRSGDFESVTTWIIGVREQVPFTVKSTGAPNHRLAITLG
jgi:hypothetical protein